MHKIKYGFFYRLYNSKEDDRKKINWNELAQNFNGMTGARLYKIFLDMLAQYVPEAEKTNFRGKFN